MVLMSSRMCLVEVPEGLWQGEGSNQMDQWSVAHCPGEGAATELLPGAKHLVCIPS
jgi:hypothetical protein